ncbi:MAG: methylated-DNA--[protein]-cysteine S-methyltransferase [Gracilibacteraceae bacterium]|nr:methylated-DNA--[protein]-cysteine S-methyltransferase [Gracilibacteraceae bacterium]
MKSLWFYDCPVGPVGIVEEDGAITQVFFGRADAPAGVAAGETQLLKKAAAQLSEYFRGERPVFDLPLSLRGTGFQLSVWAALQTIPAGETRSYGDIAAQIGNPRAARAVGMANHRNPISIIVPCHRVIGRSGALVGYGGGLPAKKYLLEMEKQYAR